MANYANQKRIELENVETIIHHKEDKTDGYYPPLEYKYIDDAAKILNGNAFKVWLYLLRWYNQGYVFFSPAAIENSMGIKKSSVSDARKELENKGYLRENDNGILIFNPTP